MSLDFVVCSVGGSAHVCRHTAPTYNDSLSCMRYLIPRRIRILTAQHIMGYSKTDCSSRNYLLNPHIVSLGCIVCGVGKQSSDCRHTTSTFNDSYEDLLCMLFQILRRIRILTAQHRPGYSKTDYNPQNSPSACFCD